MSLILKLLTCDFFSAYNTVVRLYVANFESLEPLIVKKSTLRPWLLHSFSAWAPGMISKVFKVYYTRSNSIFTYTGDIWTW
jgi:hypothetical protein